MPDLVRLCWPTMAFSSTVMALKRRTDWKVRAMPSRVRALGLSPAMLWPSKIIVPSSGE